MVDLGPRVPGQDMETMCRRLDALMEREENREQREQARYDRYDQLIATMIARDEARDLRETVHAKLIEDLVQRLNELEARNARERRELFTNIAQRIQEAVASDPDAHPQVQPVQIQVIAAHQQEVGERKVGVVEIIIGTLKRIWYYVISHPLELVKEGLQIGLVIAGVVYVFGYTPLGAILISLASNPSVAEGIAAAVVESASAAVGSTVTAVGRCCSSRRKYCSSSRESCSSNCCRDFTSSKCFMNPSW